MKDLTIIVLTYNEEKNIQDCLDSLLGISADILVVDSFSTDKTIEILKRRNIDFLQHPFENYSKQRNWAQLNDPFKNSWVFHIDADERLTPELKDWFINDFLSNENGEGFIFNRRAVFLGKWIRYGGHYPNYHLRLFKKTVGKCEDKAYDQHFVSTGKTKIIYKKDIINILSDNIGSFIIRHDKWSLLEAIDVLKKTKSGEVKSSFSGNPIERKRWLKNNFFQKSPLFLRSFLYFIYRYFIRLGFLDGRAGLIFHILQGFWFRFLIDSKIYEIKVEMERTQKSLESVIKDKYGLNI
jgi:glycosyltransferase involved in cell wall biosynthesis